MKTEEAGGAGDIPKKAKGGEINITQEDVIVKAGKRNKTCK